MTGARPQLTFSREILVENIEEAIFFGYAGLPRAGKAPEAGQANARAALSLPPLLNSTGIHMTADLKGRFTLNVPAAWNILYHSWNVLFLADDHWSQAHLVSMHHHNEWQRECVLKWPRSAAGDVLNNVQPTSTIRIWPVHCIWRREDDHVTASRR